VFKIFRNICDGREGKRIMHREDDELKNKMMQIKEMERNEYRTEWVSKGRMGLWRTKGMPLRK
jgi:hypothetical protein